MVRNIKEGRKSDENISLLHQLIITLEEAELKLEEAYRKKRQMQFNNMKDFILKIQSKISEEAISHERQEF